jgi:5-methyltetrahydrofolate--homocysteine methyltransferase
MPACCRYYGAAVVVMAFDETGQADTYERKVEICTRAYKLLTEQAGFPPEDIIFDPNVFAVATGIEEHNNYGVDFIEATRDDQASAAARAYFRRRLEPVLLVPRQRAGARGDARVFLYHAIQAGMDMGIVNAGQLPSTTTSTRNCARPARTSSQPPPPDGTERLLELAERFKGTAGAEAQGAKDLPGANGRSRSGWSMRWSTASPSSSTPTPRRRA